MKISDVICSVPTDSYPYSCSVRPVHLSSNAPVGVRLHSVVCVLRVSEAVAWYSINVLSDPSLVPWVVDRAPPFSYAALGSLIDSCRLWSVTEHGVSSEWVKDLVVQPSAVSAREREEHGRKDFTGEAQCLGAMGKKPAPIRKNQHFLGCVRQALRENQTRVTNTSA